MTDARHRPKAVHHASSSSSTVVEASGSVHTDSFNAATSNSANTDRPRRKIRLGRLAKRAGMRVVSASQSSFSKINPIPSLKTRLFDMLGTRANPKTAKTDEIGYVFVNSPRPMPTLPPPQRRRGTEDDEASGPRASSSSSCYEYTHYNSNTSHNHRKQNGAKPIDEVPIFSGWATYCGTYKPPKMVSRTHWYDVVVQQKAERVRLAHDAAVQQADAYETRLRHAVEEVIRECEEEEEHGAAVVQEHGLGLAAHRRPGGLKLDMHTAAKYTHDADGYSTPALSTPADTIGSSGPPSRTASAHFQAISDGDD